MAKTIFLISFLVLAALGIYDIYLINIYAMDIPFWDTWDLLPMGGYKHFFDFYNENMQFFYFVISEIMYQAVSWNLRYFVFVNFGIYIMLITIYGVILKNTQKQSEISYRLLFLCILLTPMLGYNWLWVFLVQTHTFILFFLLAIYFGFTKQNKAYSAILCGFCLFMSIISMNIPLAVGGAIAYIIKECINAQTNGIKKSIKNSILLISEMSFLLFLLSAVTDIRQFITIRLSHSVLSLDYIKNLSFYFINSLTIFAFAKTINWQIAVPLAIVHFSILGFIFWEQCRKKYLQSLWGIIFGVLFCMCGIIAFRGGEVYSYDFSFIRHNETAFMMLPAVMTALVLSKYKIIRGYGMIILGLSLYGIVADIKAERMQFFGELFYKNGCFCLNHYYNLKTISSWQCTMNFPIPRPDAMQKGQKMGLSFVKTIENCY